MPETGRHRKACRDTANCQSPIAERSDSLALLPPEREPQHQAVPLDGGLGVSNERVVDEVLLRRSQKPPSRLALQRWHTPILDRCAAGAEPLPEGVDVEFGHVYLPEDCAPG